MRRWIVALLTLGIVLSMPMQCLAADAGQEKILQTIDGSSAQILDISKKIWNLKEVSSKEVKSSALLEDSLQKAGFQVTKGLKGVDPYDNSACDIPTGFTATYEKIKGGPTIGIMLEYDALAMGQGCGHNLIAASGYAAAVGLKAALDTTPGKLIVFGTPAEEYGGPGKTQMVAGGLFKGVDVVLVSHPFDTWDTSTQLMALVWPRNEVMTFNGKASHAAVAPEKGKSALDAAMLFSMGVEFMREHILETSRMHYNIIEGGTAPNVVPDKVTMDIYLRSPDSNYLNVLMGKVDNIAKGAALMTDTTVDYTWDYPWYSGIRVPALYSFVKETGVELGIPESDFHEKMLGSSDLGNVGLEVPTVNVMFPAAKDGVALHSAEMVEAAISEQGQQTAIMAGKVMAVSAYKLLKDPATLQQVKDEFAKNKVN